MKIIRYSVSKPNDGNCTDEISINPEYNPHIGREFDFDITINKKGGRESRVYLSITVQDLKNFHLKYLSYLEHLSIEELEIDNNRII